MKLTVFIAFVVAAGVSIVLLLYARGTFVKAPVEAIDTKALLTAATQASSWDKAGKSTDSTRSSCQTYTFNGYYDGTTLIPAAPVLKTAILDAVAPSTTASNCKYPDQIVAKQLVRKCKGGGDQGFPCRGHDGTQYLSGQYEVYYEECKISDCKGDIGVVSVNFSAADFKQAVCLSTNSPTAGIGSVIKTLPCDPTDPMQLFVIQRDALLGQQNQGAGPVGNIVDRRTGLCVIPNSSYTGLELGKCPAPMDIILQSGQKVTRSGAWFFSDSYPFCGPLQYPGKPFGLPGDCYTGPTSSPVYAGNYTSYSPMQIVSATYTDGSAIAIPQDLYQLSQLNFPNLRSIGVDGSLQPFSKSVVTTPQLNTQVVNYYTFEFIINNPQITMGYTL